MEKITFSVPHPPTCNKMHIVSHTKRWSEKKNKWYFPRCLSKEARQYKKLVSELIFYKFNKVKYGKIPISVFITVNLPDDNRVRDISNGEKILFDAIQESGIIDNDCQIIDRRSTIGKKCGKGEWIVTIEPYIQKG